jgi:NAD(P)H-hydrate repair Nnr-like enzyme with NAD(P)H-hydrate dehydratase domain
LKTDTASIQSNRLQAARDLAALFDCVVVLKGSGSVIAAPGQTPRINTTGNGKLAIGGTGDVLAGLIGARMAQSLSGFDAACAAVHQHGQVADDWPAGQSLTASQLARALY